MLTVSSQVVRTDAYEVCRETIGTLAKQAPNINNSDTALTLLVAKRSLVVNHSPMIGENAIFCSSSKFILTLTKGYVATTLLSLNRCNQR